VKAILRGHAIDFIEKGLRGIFHYTAAGTAAHRAHTGPQGATSKRVCSAVTSKAAKKVSYISVQLFTLVQVMNIYTRL
jgi:hypothetical protein